MIEDTLSPAVLSVLRETPEVLRKMLDAATEDQLAWKPAEDRWSVAEVLGHLQHADREIYRKRIQQFLDEEDHPLFQAYDQNNAYAEGKYSGESGAVLLRRFASERWHSLALLYHLPAGAERLPARHPRFGPMTLEMMLNEWAYHDLGHLRQIAELYRACVFYPAMGVYRDHYSPRP